MDKNEIKKALKGHMNRFMKDRNGATYCVINLGFADSTLGDNFKKYDPAERDEVTEILNDLGYVPTLISGREMLLKFYI